MSEKLPFAPDVVMYHANCADGFGAAWALYQHFGDDVDYTPVDYSSPPPLEDFVGKKVLMVDVSFPRAVLQEQIAASDAFFLLDHHATAKNEVQGLDPQNVFFDMNRSGAGLAWDFAFPGLKAPLLVKTVQDRDLWRFVLPHSKELLAVLDVMPRTFAAWNAFQHRLDTELDNVIQEGKMLCLQFDSQLRTVMKTAHPIRHGSHKGWAMNAPYIFASEGGTLLAQKDDSDFGFVWVLEPNNTVRCSWRTTDDNPVTARQLAEQFGGGGHKHASGARISFDTFVRYLMDGTVPSPKKPAP